MLRFSLRTELEGANAGSLAQRLVKSFGGAAGGHGLIAGGRIPVAQDAPETSHSTWGSLLHAFLSRIGADGDGVPLLSGQADRPIPNA
jgi:hypothetical protein